MKSTELPLEYKPFAAKLLIEALVYKFCDQAQNPQLYLLDGDECQEISDYGYGKDGVILWIEEEIEPRIQQDHKTVYLDISSVSNKCLQYLRK